MWTHLKKKGHEMHQLFDVGCSLSDINDRLDMSGFLVPERFVGDKILMFFFKRIACSERQRIHCVL